MRLFAGVARASAVLALTVQIVSCGGGGSGSASPPPPAATLSATFSDAPVSGLSYSAMPSGTIGTTNSLGLFNYAAGDTVTFSAAGVALGAASNLPTTSSSGIPAVITPINLVAGATDATNPTVTAIGQFLGALNSVAVAVGQGSGGRFNIPSPTGLTGSQATTVATLLGTIQSSSTTAANLATAVSSGGAVQVAIAAAGGTVPMAANAQANITQGLNSAGVVGSLWTAACTACAGGAGITLYFNPDGVVRGFGAISSASGGGLIGTWKASASSSGSASFTVVTSPGGQNPTGLDGTYLSGVVSGSSGTAQIFNSSRVAQGSALTLTATAIAAGTNTTYVGGWELFIDTVAPDSGGVKGSSAFVLFLPDGHWYTSAGGLPGGTFDPATGIVSATSTTEVQPMSCGGQHTQRTNTFTMNLATGTLSQTVGGTTNAGGHVVRVGSAAEVLDRFYDNAGTLAESTLEAVVPLSLNVSISWPANTASATTSLALGVVLTGPANAGTACNPSTATKLETWGLRPEINPFGSGASAGSATDTFAVGYVKGQAQNYQVSVLGPASQFCSVTTNGNGTVVDANSGNASAYPTVQVVCTQ